MRCIRGCFFLGLVWAVVSAQAALSLELTQGMAAALPVGLQPFEHDNLATVSGNTTFTAVIHNDLTNSGEFKVVEPGLLDSMRASKSHDNKVWQKRGVNDVITGQITPMPDGRYRVHFQLVDVYAPKDNVLLSQTFVTTAAGLRPLAHHVSDLIYQQLTGVRGIFSTRIAYVLSHAVGTPQARYDLVVADADGFNPHVLLSSSDPILSPTWEPDGQALAYVSFENHHEAIYLQQIKTGHRRLVSNLPGINSAPAFSPDGKQLAVVLSTTGNPKIYTFNRSTHQLKQVTHGYSIDTEPAWAADGKSLLFTSDRGGSAQIYRVYLDDGRVERVTFDGHYNARAAFVPGQQAIVMMHRQDKAYGVARQDLENGFVQVLTQGDGNESPSVSPNGKMVIYAQSQGSKESLAVVSIDGHIQLRLPSQDGNVQEPAWSPFLAGASHEKIATP